MENRPKIKIGGREIPLKYSVYENIAIQRELGCTGSEIREKVFGIRKVEDDEKNEPDYVFDIVKDGELQLKFGNLIKILGNAGLEEEGKEQDLDEKWILRNMKPAELILYVMGVWAVVNDAYSMENAKKQDGPVDETLEEENAKKQQGN